MNLMRGGETSQAQQLQDDVAGVAPIKEVSVLVSFVLREARLVHGAALCGGSLARGTVITGVTPPFPTHCSTSLATLGFIPLIVTVLLLIFSPVEPEPVSV